MPLEQELNDLLKQAMREKDSRTSDVVRMIKTKVMERRTAKGFTGTVDDTLVREVIAAYRKQLQKGMEEFVAAGERGKEQAAELKFEVEFCGRFLPKGLDEAAVRAIVKEKIAALGVKDVKQVGRVMGEVMKAHKGEVEAGDVKRIAEEEIAKG